MNYAADLLELKTIATELLDHAGQRNAYEINSLLDILVSNFSVLGVTRSHHHIWYRARLSDSIEGFANIREMLYPPNGSTTYGRASVPGSRVLYAGWNHRVALEEIGAEKGAIVQVIRLRVRAPLEFPCAVVGDYQSIFNSGRSGVNSQRIVARVNEIIATNPAYFTSQVFVDSVLSELFRRKVSCQDDYASSAIFAAKVLAKRQGLMYPSVRTSHAINLAVRAEDVDHFFEVLDSEVFRITDYLGYGLYSLKRLRYTCSISSSGIIDWDSNRQMVTSTGSFRDEQIPPGFLGWRATP